MKQQTKTNLLLAAILTFVLAVGLILAASVVMPTKVRAESDVILSQTFDGADVPAGWEDLIGSVEDGMGQVKQGGLYSIPLPAESLVESNNYEVSFDIIRKGEQGDAFFFHIIGLNGNDNTNIYLASEGNGQYWSLSDFHGHPVYNNSGEEHGGLNYAGVDLTQKHTVKIVHFDGYVELWLDGTRRAVSHLSHFGNNNYHARGEITEGKIAGFAFDARLDLYIDNVQIKEAKGASVTYSEHSDNMTTDSSRIFPLSAQNLYNGNFEVVAKFAYADITATNYYPNVTIYGLNNSTGDTNNGNHYGVAFQAYADREYITPQIFARKVVSIDDTNGKENSDWASASGDAVTCNSTDGVEYRIQVFGDNIRYYVNGELKIETTFTELGIEKGHAQYIRIQSGFGGAYWTDFSYQGFDKETAVTIAADKTRAKLGETVTLNATMFGAETAETFDWYVDNVAKEVSELTLTLSDLTEGAHTIVYKSESFVSNEITVEVFDNMITIESDKSSGYATDTFTFTADLSGDFTEDAPVWYLDGEALEGETGETLVLTELSVGTHKVVLKNETVTSNEVEITVNEGTLTLTTAKNNYQITESATVTAETVGVLESDTLTWKVNGDAVEVEDKVLTIDLSAYKKGDVIIVECKTASGLESSVTINIYFDIMAEISADANYKTLNSVALVAGQKYGSFDCVEDANGNYLASLSGGQGYYSIPNAIPETMSFALSYEMYVPETIERTNYSYPGFLGLNSKYPDGFVEIAIEVNKTGFRPYIKDQAAQKEYDVADYGFGVDLSYSGIAKKGDWNKVSYVVSGKYLAMYINDVQVYFVNYPNMTLPSGVNFNTWAGDASLTPFIRFRNIEVSGIREERPPLSSVSISTGKTKIEVNETLEFKANVTPYNADYSVIEWYVNDVKVDGADTLSYTFSQAQAGEYKIYCKIDGISSAVKTITVEAGGKTPSDGGKLPTYAIALIAVGAALIVGGGAAAAVIVVKKRKSAGVTADDKQTADSSDENK